MDVLLSRDTIRTLLASDRGQDQHLRGVERIDRFHPMSQSVPFARAEPFGARNRQDPTLYENVIAGIELTTLPGKLEDRVQA